MQQHSANNQFDHSNKLTGCATSPSASPTAQLSSPARASPSPTSQGQGRAAKPVTPATVIAWLREHYKLGKHGYSKKAAVFAHYQALCAERGAESSISSTFFGKLVKRAFPEIKTIRKGPRGKVEQCYDRLKPVDPAKASRARWLERVNLYLAALQTSSGANAQQPPASHAPAARRCSCGRSCGGRCVCAGGFPVATGSCEGLQQLVLPRSEVRLSAQPDHHHLPPRASHPTHQSHYYAAVEGGAGAGHHPHHQLLQHQHNYASSLDGGHYYLASLLPSFDSPSPSSSFASSPAPSSPASAELAHHHPQAPHDHAPPQQQQQQQQQRYRGYESFESVQPTGACGVAARQDNASWQPQQQQQPGGLSRSAYTPAATMGYHHHQQQQQHHHHQEMAAGPYTTLLAGEPSPLYADHHHHLDHASFALYL